MKKFFLFLFCIKLILFSGMHKVLAENHQLKPTNSRSDQIISKPKYYRITESDLKKLERQALLNKSLLQRIRDLEHLYMQIESLVKGVKIAINTVGAFLNIDLNSSFLDLINDTQDHFEHISGVIMEPGAVVFKVSTRSGESFDDLGLNVLEFDLLYNKNLFTIDHIEGKKVLGEDFSLQSLSKNLRAIKDRIELPLTDVLSSEAEFKVFLAPLYPEKIRVGDRTEMDIRYYKRIPKNPDGSSGESPLIYQLLSPSRNFVEVVVK